jgi:very-short-patch-repair endonuclease
VSDAPLHNRKYLKKYRKELRNNLTPAEAELWNHLKSKQLAGRKFRRQHSIGNYIVDFYCPQEKLIIELEGEVHNDVIRHDYDQERKNDLESLGYTVLVFENKEVFKDIENLLTTVRRSFNQ